jgi:hypothetical protein
MLARWDDDQDGRCDELIEWFMQQPVAAEGG